MITSAQAAPVVLSKVCDNKGWGASASVGTKSLPIFDAAQLFSAELVQILAGVRNPLACLRWELTSDRLRRQCRLAVNLVARTIGRAKSVQAGSGGLLRLHEPVRAYVCRRTPASNLCCPFAFDMGQPTRV